VGDPKWRSFDRSQRNWWQSLRMLNEDRLTLGYVLRCTPFFDCSQTGFARTSPETPLVVFIEVEKSVARERIQAAGDP